MLNLSSSRRYFIFNGVTDFRKGFDGLCSLVQNVMKQNSLSGDVYIFFNRRRTAIKLLLWEGDGYSIYSKRLEKGTFEIPSHSESPVSSEVLSCMLYGISLKHLRKRKRYKPAA